MTNPENFTVKEMQKTLLNKPLNFKIMNMIYETPDNLLPDIPLYQCPSDPELPEPEIEVEAPELPPEED